MKRQNDVAFWPSQYICLLGAQSGLEANVVVAYPICPGGNEVRFVLREIRGCVWGKGCDPIQ